MGGRARSAGPSPELKREVALEAIRGEQPREVIAAYYDVTSHQVREWEDQVREGASLVFGKGQDSRRTLVWPVIVAAIIGAVAVLLAPHLGSLGGCSPTTRIICEGHVLDAKTKCPIADAKVSLDFHDSPIIVFADSEGFYHSEVLVTAEKMYGRIKVEADGYEPYERNITLSPPIPSHEEIRLCRSD